MQECSFRVYYEDTDAGGVVYHARYLHFFERARTEYLRHLGFEQRELLKKLQLAFVVKTMDIDYHAPAQLDNIIQVQTDIKDIKGASILFEQTMWREQECLVTAVVKVATVNLNKMKVVALPKDIRSALEQEYSVNN